MKYRLLFFGVYVCMSMYIYTREDYQIILEPRWEDLEEDASRAMQFGGKLLLVGSIIFKKNAKDPVLLNYIQLSWKGEIIDNLVCSLYKKIPDRDFLPIQDYLVCDGVWNKRKQQILLRFEQEQFLGPTTIFYLVFMMPEHLEKTVKSGFFSIDECCLPGPFKQCVCPEQLNLAFLQASSAAS